MLAASSLTSTTCVDVTREFHAAVAAAQASGASTPHKTIKTQLAHPVVTGRLPPEFSQAVREVSGQLGHTALRLAELTRLVRNRGTFNDRSADIAELTASIKHDISELEHELQRIQTIVEDHSKYSRDKQGSLHSAHVVASLKSQLLVATQSFKGVLQVRHDSLRAQSSRRAKFGGSRELGRPLPLANRMALTNGSTAGVSAGAAAGTAPLLANDSSSKVEDADAMFAQVSAVALRPEQAYLESRAADIQAIESTIVELGTMFQKVAHFVALQGEQIERIDTNLERAQEDITRGTWELTTALQSASSNRLLIAKIFGILLVFIVFWSVFLV